MTLGRVAHENNLNNRNLLLCSLHSKCAKALILAALAGCSNWDVKQVPAGAILNTKTGCYKLAPIRHESRTVATSVCAHGFVTDLYYGAGAPLIGWCGDPYKAPVREWCG